MGYTKKQWLSLITAALICLTACGGGKTPDQPQTPAPPSNSQPDESPIIDAVKYGIDNTGGTDMTQKMIAMHKEGAEKGKPIYYPDGTYLFNGTTLDFTSGIQCESADGVLIRNSISATPIVNFDDKGNLIGLMQNHLELKYNQQHYVDNGQLVSPPISTATYETAVDFLPYWYNDFGLKRTATANGKNGWIGWYDWRWNHHDCEQLGVEGKPYDPYDPARHPLLGYYHGDDPVVLDWICYWLQEYGIRQTTPFVGSALNTDRWTDPSSSYHWVYQLLNHTPNAKSMDFGFFVASSSYSMDIEFLKKSWWTTFDTFYFNPQYADMVYCYEVGDKRYPVIHLWDEEAIYNSLGKSYDKMIELYQTVAQAFQDKGYAGVCIMACEPQLGGADRAVDRAKLQKAGAIWFASEYGSHQRMYEENYIALVEGAWLSNDTSVLYGVATGLHSHTPHESRWYCDGNTPALFGQWVKKAVDATLSDKKRAKIVVCYNVSEWAEGGPGLIPTVADRFGYLEAVRDHVVIDQ